MDAILTSVQLRNLFTDAINIGRLDMAVQLGLVQDSISQREAFRRFTEKRVRTWRKRKLIEPHKAGDGNTTVYYSLTQLTILDNAEKNNL